MIKSIFCRHSTVLHMSSDGLVVSLGGGTPAPPVPIDPVAWTLTKRLVPSTISDFFADFDPVSAGCTLVMKNVRFPSSNQFVQNGDAVLLKLGGSTRCFYAGVRDVDGFDASSTKIPVLRIRASNSTSLLGENGTVVLDIADFPTDGRLHSVVVDVEPSAPASIRCWIDGSFRGEYTIDGSMLDTDWIGTDDGGFGVIGATLRPDGESATPWPVSTTDMEADGAAVDCYVGRRACPAFASPTSGLFAALQIGPSRFYGGTAYGYVPTAADIVKRYAKERSQITRALAEGYEVDARGGDRIFHLKGYRVHVFTQSGTFAMKKGGKVDVYRPPLG